MITNKWILGNGDYTDALKLRHQVFVEEQGVTEEPDPDELDAMAMHLVIYDEEKPVATGRVYHDGKSFCLGRICVKNDVRGQGIGDLLMKLLILKAFEFSPSEVKIGAQKQAENFYKRYGFFETGDAYMEVGIPHVPMSITKESMVFPSKCGKEKHFEDFFDRKSEPI